MAKIGKSSVCLRVISFFAILGVALSKVVYPVGGHPKNFNYRYERSGETLKAAASHTPYTSEYELEEGGYSPTEYETAESANFGSYNLGGPGQISGGGGGGGYSDGGQFGNLGYSAQGGGFGLGNGFNGYSSGYSSGLGNGYNGQQGYYSGGLGGGLGGGMGGGLGGGIGGGLGGGIGGGIGGGVGGGLGGGLGGGIGGGVGGGYIQRPFITGGGGGYSGVQGGHGGQGGQIGGGYVDNNRYESAKKNAGDENLEKVEAKAGNSANQGAQGFNQGAAEQSNAKADSGFYKDQTANKKEIGDGKTYQGAQTVDKTGKNGESENAQKSHKKGHITKGFKSSSRKDEEEKTETFYDEAHDEADRKNLKQNEGAFGEKSAASFKGGHENESLDAKAQGKEGQFNSQQKIDDTKTNKGEFGQTAYKGNSEVLHKANGLGAQSILGHQESSGQYLHKKPYGILPIHGDK